MVEKKDCEKKGFHLVVDDLNNPISSHVFYTGSKNFLFP